jgi:hypothetical protein
MLGVGSFGHRESPNPILGSHCRSGRRWGMKPELGCRGGSCSTADVQRCGVLGALAAATTAPSRIWRGSLDFSAHEVGVNGGQY